MLITVSGGRGVLESFVRVHIIDFTSTSHIQPHFVPFTLSGAGALAGDVLFVPSPSIFYPRMSSLVPPSSIGGSSDVCPTIR